MAEQKRTETRTVEQQRADTRGLLDQIISDHRQREKLVNWGLQEQIEKLRELLPPQYKSQAERFCKRAILTIDSKKDIYKDCRPASFIRCVLQAAEFGLAIDGRLAHAVPFKGDLAFMPDYKGIIAVAKRSGIIEDCWPRAVFANDEFDMWDENGKSFYRWKPALDGQGEFRGVVSVVVTKAGWRCDWMNREEVYKIRARSSYYAVKKAGPWVTDEIEMAKKTGVKRIMKLYQDDPALTRLMEIDDLEYEVEPEAPEIPSPPVGKFTPKNGRRKQDAPPAADQELKQETTKETFVGAKPETCKAIREHFVLSGEPPSETLKNFPGKECWEDLTEDEACDVLAALRGVENG